MVSGTKTTPMRGTPRVGVYICHCGKNIAGVVDVESVNTFASQLENVIIARNYTYMCSDPGQEIIAEDIRQFNLDRVVVASCTPLMHESTFRRVCADAGMNPYLFQMANIREHCSWITNDPLVATEKAKALVGAAVQRVAWQAPLEIRQVAVKQSALVVGGGISGIEAALRLADSGKHVTLVEREPSIGGHMSRLYKTFPTLDCAAWILTPKMVSVGRHPNIDLLSYSEVEKVSGYVGNFDVTIRRKQRFVDEETCNGCGTCVEKCPWKKIPSEFDLGLGKRAAIYFPFAQAVPRVPVIDTVNCAYFKSGKCRACEKFCPRGSINFTQQEEHIEIEVGTIIVATGFSDFDPNRSAQYGYGKYENILTGMEFERMINSGGPTNGQVVLKDGRKPERIAILHCVGSRGDHNEYCSRVCCMYSLKLAQLTRDYVGAEVIEYYRDLRSFGKGYEAFYEKVKQHGVHFVRFEKGLRIEKENDNLIVIATDVYTGEEQRAAVDMVVLSTGMEPQRDAHNVAQIFGISNSPDGFFLEKHPKLAPVETTTDGIFLAGACQGPKDIPDSVAQGGAAASAALALMDAGHVTLEPFTSYVTAENCGDCCICANQCPYGAIEMIEASGAVQSPAQCVAHVNEVLCKGCGACVAACPAGAIIQHGYTNEQVLAEIDGILMALTPAVLQAEAGLGISQEVT